MHNKNPKLKLRLSQMYSVIIEELKSLAEIEGSQTICLDILKQLPQDIQPEVIKELASLKRPEFIPFFQLIIQEEMGEIKQRAKRALVKMQYLGYTVEEAKLSIYKYDGKISAYCSPSRLVGNCILVFITKSNKEYIAHFFTLFFNHLGIREYFQYRSLRKEEILDTIKSKGLVKLSFDEGRTLLRDAYGQNIRYGTKVATGFSQYQQLLEGAKEVLVENIQYQGLLQKINGRRFSPKKVTNALLLALKNMDAPLIYDLATESLQREFGKRKDFLQKWTHPLEKYSFIKTIIRTRLVDKEKSINKIKLIASDVEDNLKKIDLKIELVNNAGHHLVSNMEIEEISPITSRDPLSPLNHKVYTCIYKVDCYEKIKNAIENHDFLYLSGEFENGVCYKWFKNCDPLEYGIDISKNIYGEFILTSEELIVFSSNLRNLTEITGFIQNNCQNNNLQLTIKTLCTIKEIYKVITNKIVLRDKLVNKAHTYLIPPAKLKKWKLLCSELDKTSFRVNNNEVFHLTIEKIKIEIIFYENYGIMNLFNTSLEILQRHLNLPDKEIYPLEHILDGQEKDNWSILKLVRELKKDPFIKVYLPLANATTREMANYFELVIT